MSWLSDRTGIRLNLRSLAPAAGAALGHMVLPGLGGAALGSAFGRFADDKAHGAGWGDAAKAGAITGGLTYGGGKALQALRGAFAPSSSGSTYGPGSGAPGADIPSGMSGMEELLNPGAVAGAGGAGGFSFGNAARGVSRFAKDNPMAVSGALQGAGRIATAGAENELTRASARRTATAADSDDYELRQRKARDEALEPIRRALAGQLSSLRASQYGIAPNPWTPRG